FIFNDDRRKCLNFQRIIRLSTPGEYDIHLLGKVQRTWLKCGVLSGFGVILREPKALLDSKARYSSFKLKELDKTEEPKALLSVDSMLNWSDHEGEDVENGAAQVNGMIAGAEEDATGNATSDVADDVSNAAAEFALMGISSQAKLEKLDYMAKLEESKARFEKWKDSSKNLDKLIHSSMSSRSKFGLGFGETFRSDEELYSSSNNPDIDDTQFTMVQVTQTQKTHDFASCFQVSSPQAQDQ
ncbi:hypothetical protein Tco_0868826, partial [Tanacetum coccineum]